MPFSLYSFGIINDGIDVMSARLDHMTQGESNGLGYMTKTHQVNCVGSTPRIERTNQEAVIYELFLKRDSPHVN